MLTRKRLVIAIGVVLVVIVTVIGVLQLLPDDDTAAPAAPAAVDDTPERHLSATELTTQFLDALTSGDAAAAGALTDNAADATATLTDVWHTLAPTSVSASRDQLVEPAARANAATEKFTLSWDLGEGRAWEYPSAVRLVRKSTDWRVWWQPALVHPRLSAGHHLVVGDRTGHPAVVDRDRRPLLSWAQAGTSPTDPSIAPLLLPAMGRVAEERGSDGWYVGLTDDAGKETAVLFGSRVAAFTSTLSRSVQDAAQRAVDTQQLPTTLVAIQPSTGDLLAVAQNPVAGDDPVALHGLNPPGSTFKIVTATAVIEAGGTDVDTIVPCPRSKTIGQRTVENAGFQLGDVPLRRAFAKSCNTTFAALAAELPPDALPRAADQLGLGADFAIPGITTEAGSVPDAPTTTEKVENGIGQGRVQASCFGLAMMVATVAAGRPVTPRLWRELKTTVNIGYRAPPADVLGSVRTMMRDVVTSGTGNALAKYGDVLGKTGTAQVGDGSQAHGWFAGYRDDIAFATLVLNGETSKTAVNVTGTFLGALGR